jgi:hypothetical protein
MTAIASVPRRPRGYQVPDLPERQAVRLRLLDKRTRSTADPSYSRNPPLVRCDRAVPVARSSEARRA